MPKFGTYELKTNIDGTEIIVVKDGATTKRISVAGISQFTGEQIGDVSIGSGGTNTALSIVTPESIPDTMLEWQIQAPTSRLFVDSISQVYISRIIANKGMNSDGTVITGNVLEPPVIDAVFGFDTTINTDPSLNGNIRMGDGRLSIDVMKGNSLRFVHDGTNYIVANKSNGYVDIDYINDTTLASSNYIIAKSPRVEIDMSANRTLRNIYTPKGWIGTTRDGNTLISPSVLYVRPNTFALTVESGVGNIIDESGNSTVQSTEVMMFVNFGDFWYVVNTNI